MKRRLSAFEAARRPIVEKLVAAADSSGAWYDRFPEHMNLSPRDFAWSYIQRSGRIDPERLARISPRFAKKRECYFPLRSSAAIRSPSG